MIKYLRSLIGSGRSILNRKKIVELSAYKLACRELLDVEFYLATYPDIAIAGVDPLGHYIDCGFAEGRLPLSIKSFEAASRIRKALEFEPLNSMAVRLNLMLNLSVSDLNTISETLRWFKDTISVPELVQVNVQLIEDAAVDLLLKRYRNEITNDFSEIQSVLEQFSNVSPPSERIKAALALSIFRVGKLKAAGERFAELSSLDSTSPELAGLVSEAILVVAEAALVNSDVLKETKLLLLDSSFPSKVSSFRYGEFKSVLEAIDDSAIQTLPDNLSKYGESLPFHAQVEQFIDSTGLDPSRVRYFDTDFIGAPKVAYCVFLNLADYFYTQLGLPSAEHLLFTLYPGGGFNLNDKVSDQKLRQLCDNPKLSKIITTQNTTYRYLVDGGFCEPDRIKHIYGGIIPSIYSMDAESIVPRELDKPLDVCFVAQRYSATGAEKGYDVFIDIVKDFKNSPDVRFHVVGGFDESTIELGGVRNITFYGARPADFFDVFYTKMDLILSPNIHASALDPTQPDSFDGFPTTAVVEAGLKGVAVFLTDFKGMNQHLDGSSIFKDHEMKIIDRNACSISKLIRKYLSDRPALFELGASGRRAILREFSYDVQMRPRIELIQGYLSVSWLQALKTRLFNELLKLKSFMTSAVVPLQVVSSDTYVATILDKRVSLVSPYFDAGYWSRHHQPNSETFVEPVVDYINKGSDSAFGPHPLFDNKYYLSQLPGVRLLEVTLLEHYILEGAAAGLDPSPFFCTQYYCDSYPDIKEAGINPLLHFIHSGIYEGREAVPMVPLVLKSDSGNTLSNDSFNAFALAYQAINCGSQNNFKDAIRLLRSAKDFLPVPFYLKVCGICFCLAGRFSAAKDIFVKLSKIPGILDCDNLFSFALTKAGAIAEARGDISLAYKNYSLACKDGYELAAHSLFNLGRICFSQGQTLNAIKFIKESKINKDEFDTLIMRMRTVRDHCVEVGDTYHEIYPARPIQDASLRFLDESPELTSQAGDLLAPPFYLAFLENSMAFSKCNIVISDQEVVLDGVSNPVFSRAVIGDTFNNEKLLFSTRLDQALVQMPNKKLKMFDRGLMMFGVQSANYGHWFLEYLPRMLAFDSELCGKEFSIVVDANIPQSHLQSLNLLNSKKRPIVTLQPNERVAFSTLGMAPVPAFFPLDVDEGAAYDAVWPRDIFSQLKAKILEGLETEGFVFSKIPTRLFLSRRSFSSRQLVNEVELENFLHDIGFITIYPETMSFSEQVDVFQSASIVVGSCSSALTNAIFCNSGARIVALINDCLDFNFRGYSSFIEAGGAEIIFVRGVSLPDQGAVHRYHKSYTISAEAFTKAINWAVQ
jgi:tetratricopeptide (TPR) repeat protein